MTIFSCVKLMEKQLSKDSIYTNPWSTSPNKAGRGCLIITGQIIHNTSNICFTSKNPINWNQQLHARTHSLVGDQPCQAHPQQLIFLLIHFWDGNMKSGFKKENDWVEIWPVFARTESLFCFLPCRVRLSAETGSLLYPHSHRPAQRRRKLRVWPWPCSGMGHQGEGRADPPRPGAAISGPWGKISKQCGAEGRWGPAWILGLDLHSVIMKMKETKRNNEFNQWGLLLKIQINQFCPHVQTQKKLAFLVHT